MIPKRVNLQQAKWLVLFFAFFLFRTANAQQFQFGIHASPSLSFINTDQEGAETDGDMLFGFGLISEYQFADKYAFRSGVDIMQRGGDLTVNDTAGEYRSTFLQIPISIKMRTQEYGYITYFARFGGALAFETSEKTSHKPDFPDEQQLDSYVPFLNTLMEVGGGIEYNIGGQSRIVAGLFYTQCLFDSIRDEDPRLSEDNNYRFNSVMLTLGILF